MKDVKFLSAAVCDCLNICSVIYRRPPDHEFRVRRGHSFAYRGKAMDSLTTETRDIGDIAGLRGQCLQRWQAGVVLSAFMRASTTRGYGGVAVRRPHQPCGFLLRIARSGEEDGGGVRPANLGAAVQFSCANAVRRIPLGHVPKVRPYRRAGYGPRIVGDGVRTVNANDVRCPEARADNRGIGGCQQRRFASARKSLLLPMCADTAVCHSKPLILFGSALRPGEPKNQ